MNEMVEQVARAIAAELWRQGFATNEIPDVARAAIAAMREPPDFMADPYWCLSLPGASYAQAPSARAIWQAAIDAILK